MTLMANIGHLGIAIRQLMRGPAGETGDYVLQIDFLGGDADLTAPLISARERGLDVVRIEYRLADLQESEFTQLTPANFRCVFVLGNSYARRDCTAWTADEAGPIVLVPTDPKFDEHYAIGAGGRFQWRPGRPARDLSQGAKTVVERLRATTGLVAEGVEASANDDLRSWQGAAYAKQYDVQIREFLTHRSISTGKITVALKFGGIEEAWDAALVEARSTGGDLVGVESIGAPGEDAGETVNINWYCVFAHNGHCEQRECIPWAATADAPIIMVSNDKDYDEHYVIGEDGQYRCVEGLPEGDLGTGVELAMARLRDTLGL